MERKPRDGSYTVGRVEEENGTKDNISRGRSKVKGEGVGLGLVLVKVHIQHARLLLADS